MAGSQKLNCLLPRVVGVLWEGFHLVHAFQDFDSACGGKNTGFSKCVCFWNVGGLSETDTSNYNNSYFIVLMCLTPRVCVGGRALSKSFQLFVSGL